MATQAMDRIAQIRSGHDVMHSRHATTVSVPGAAFVTHLADASKPVVPCCTCISRGVCPVARLVMFETECLDHLYLYSRTLTSGEHVFYEGDAFEAVYVVKTGSVKACLTSGMANEQVVSFHLPGELLGLDALGTKVHGSSAVALEDATVCAIETAHLEEFISRSAGALWRFFEIAAGEIVRNHHTSLILTRMKAAARLSDFLLDLSERFRVRGYSAREFNLSMSRHDIGNYLSLSVETVSRLMARFQCDGLLEVDRRRITIRNATSLGVIAGIPCRDRLQ